MGSTSTACTYWWRTAPPEPPAAWSGPRPRSRGSEHERVAHTALERVALPTLERGVAGQGPAPGVVPARAEAAEVVEVGQLVAEVVGLVGDVVAELVPGAVRSALGRRAVVGHEHDDRAVGLAGGLEVVEHPADVVVGVGDEPGADLHHPGVEPAPVVVEVGPGLDPVGSVRQLGAGRHDAELDLAAQRRRPPGVPPVVEATAVAARSTRGAPGAERGVRAVANQSRNGRSGCELAQLGRGSRWPGRPGPRSGGSPPRGSPAARRGSCRARGSASTGWSRR